MMPILPLTLFVLPVMKPVISVQAQPVQNVLNAPMAGITMEIQLV